MRMPTNAPLIGPDGLVTIPWRQFFTAEFPVGVVPTNMPMLAADESIATTWQMFFEQGGTLIPPGNAPLVEQGQVTGPWLQFFGT